MTLLSVAVHVWQSQPVFLAQCLPPAPSYLQGEAGDHFRRWSEG